MRGEMGEKGRESLLEIERKLRKEVGTSVEQRNLKKETAHNICNMIRVSI